MNNENVICKTECKYKMLLTISAIVWWGFSILAMIPSGYSTVHKDTTASIFFGTIPAVTLYGNDDIFIYKGAVLLVLFLVFAPIVVYIVNRFLANRCRLMVTDKYICGDVSVLFLSKKIQMPLDKLDNIMISTSIIDECRGGETIIVSSNSCKIKFPYVYNAKEFVKATLDAMEQNNKNRRIEL